MYTHTHAEFGPCTRHSVREKERDKKSGNTQDDEYDFMRHRHRCNIKERNQFHTVQGFSNPETKTFYYCRSPYGSLRENKRCIKARFALLAILRVNYTFSKATSEQWYCIINHISGQVSASAALLLMLRIAIYPTYSKFGICTVNHSFKVHSPVLLMVLFYCLSLTQLHILPLYIAHPTFFILSLHNTLNSF